jgi:serine/threonine-protein kinase ATR
VLDYLSRWLQEKNQQLSAFVNRSRSTHVPANFDELTEKLQISSVEQIITAVSPKVIAKRAAECGSYTRSIYHTEQHMRQLGMKNVEEQYKHLQSVYEQINEPDGVEGISGRFPALDLSQQIVDHKRAGRWAAALSYYELGVQDDPSDTKMQTELFSCLKASGDYDALINTVSNLMATSRGTLTTALPFATEAAWMTGKWETLEQLLQHDQTKKSQDFNVGLSRALLAVRQQDAEAFQSTVADLRKSLSGTFKPSITSSMSNAHNHLLKLHVLHEVEALSGLSEHNATKLNVLPGRLDVLGSYTEDKLYILGVRRAVMEASRFVSLSVHRSC